MDEKHENEERPEADEVEKGRPSDETASEQENPPSPSPGRSIGGGPSRGGTP